MVNPEFLQRGYLKKQSQFPKGQNNVKSILSMLYGDYNGPRRRKNKPNSKPKQSQFENPGPLHKRLEDERGLEIISNPDTIRAGPEPFGSTKTASKAN